MSVDHEPFRIAHWFINSESFKEMVGWTELAAQQLVYSLYVGDDEV